MNHLSEEQFSSLLLEQGDAAAQAHLAACADCRAELERVREPLTSFHAIGMEWAEQRSATMRPVQAATAGSRRVPLAWAAVAAMVVGALFAGMHREQRLDSQKAVAAGTASEARVAPATVAPTAVTPEEQAALGGMPNGISNETHEISAPRVKAQEARRVREQRIPEQRRIEEDNQLLAAIDHELNSDVSLLVPVSELRTADRKPQSRLND